jgi:protein-L-isoaspartate(D-aspartate) O-methyltransferase
MNILLTLVLLSFLLAGCSTKSSSTAAPSVPVLSPTPEVDEYFEARQKLAEEIRARGNISEEIVQIMASVPRHEFVPTKFLDQAYEDHPLPIGYGQTISQPFIVAWMTNLLELQPGEKVLEIGTGSGYQAAVLAELEGVDVYTIEIVPELADQSAALLEKLGYTDIHTRQGDGYYGWEEFAPFDAILVTAAPDHLPAPLVEQLSEDGRLVIPIGPQGWVQTLWKFAQEDGELKAYNLGGVQFVPFTGPGAEDHAGEGIPIP